MNLERIAFVLGTSQFTEDLATLRAVLGEPTFVDGTSWAQFDSAGSRVCLAGEGQGVAESALLLKVADLDDAGRALAEARCALGERTVGDHEERLFADDPVGQDADRLPAALNGGNLRLEAVGPLLARVLIEGGDGGLTGAPGWLRPETLHALQMIDQGAEVWLVLLDGRVVGDCGTHGPPGDQGEIEIGYGLAEGERGRGTGTAAVAELVALLGARTAVRRIVARTSVENVASRRCLERAGFVPRAGTDGTDGTDRTDGTEGTDGTSTFVLECDR